MRRSPFAAAVLVAALLPCPRAHAADPVGGPRLAAFGLITNRPAGTPPPPIVLAQAYVVADAESGAVLAAKAPHVPLRPASTLKALTAVTIFPTLSVGREIAGTQADANIEGSRAGIVPGGTYTVNQLWQAVFLRSGNDAIHALAVANGGVASTVAQMNAKAIELHALDTHAVTPDGLDEDGQLSSAYDLALIGRAGWRMPELTAYASLPQAPFPGKPVAGGRRSTFQLWSQQKFVQHYQGAIGLKNGYTHLAGNTLIALAQRNGRTVIVTVLGDKGRAWQEAEKLADWYFRYGGAARPVGQLVEPGTVAAPATTASPKPESVVAAPLRALSLPVHHGTGLLWRAGVAALGFLSVLAVLRTRAIRRRRRRRARRVRPARV